MTPKPLPSSGFSARAALLGTLGWLLAGALSAAGEPPAPPTGLVSAPYALDPRPDGFTICWQTAAEQPGAVRFRAEGASAWTEVRDRGQTCYHAVRLAGLSAGTDYQLEVLTGPGGAPLGALELRTAPASPKGFTFYVYGDTQGPPDVHSRATRAALDEARRLNQFAFLLHAGDLSGAGDERSMHRQLLAPAAELLARVPLVPVRGNHDADWPALERLFPAPERVEFYDETWDYCLDYGAARLVVLDGSAPARTRDRRMNWLRDRLAEAAGRWRLVAVHQPLWTRGEHADDEYGIGLRALFEPYLVAGRVHAVFSGHEHVYQRSHPIKGVTHFTCGGGGTYSRTLGLKPRKWSARFETVDTFLAVEVSAEKLVVRALAATGPGLDAFAEIDSVEIPRECGWPGVDLSAVPRTGVNLEMVPNPLRPVLLWGGIALLVLGLGLKLARWRRARARSA